MAADEVYNQKTQALDKAQAVERTTNVIWFHFGEELRGVAQVSINGYDKYSITRVA